MGKLRDPNGGLQRPSILEATKYLPSLHDAVWEKSEMIPEVPFDDQHEIDKGFQLAIRRARIGVEILKRPSDDRTKFDLFQKLNAGGTQANAQELRNCIMLMINGDYFRSIKEAADQKSFQDVVSITGGQIERQRPMELAVRFLVHTLVAYDGKLDAEEYINNGIVELARLGNAIKDAKLMRATFKLLNDSAGKNILRRQENGHPIGKVGLVGLEAVAVGVAKNLKAIRALADPLAFIKGKVSDLWIQPEIMTFVQPGLRARLAFNGQFRSGKSGLSLSKPCTANDFSAQINEELTWRLREISDLKAAIRRSDRCCKECC